MKMARISSIVCLMVICYFGSATCWSAQAAPGGRESAEMDAILLSARARWHLVSITAEARKDGEVIYARSLGSADLQNDVPATPQGLYAIGSITKSLTSFCILNLVHEGKLKLNDRVGDILPYYDGPSRNVTIRELLTHTSGVLDYAGDSAPALFGNPVNHFTERDVVDEFKDKPLVFKPGSHWQYSNSGYYLLSLVVEKVSGQPYADAVRRFVLKPFALDEMALGERTPIIKKRVMGYTIDASGRIQNASGWGATLPLGAGAFLASADDLTRYIADLFSPKVSAAVHRMMFDRVSLPDGTVVNYLPAALVESDFYGHPKFSHGGGIWGFLTFVTYYPKDRLAITVMVNTDNVVSSKNPQVPGIERKIARVLLGIPQPRIARLPLKVAEAAKYVGTYEMPEYLMSGNRVTFVYAHHTLFMSLGSKPTSYINWQNAQKGIQYQGSSMIELVNQGHGRFVEEGNHEDEVTFSGGKSGHLNVELGFEGWPFIGRFVGR